MFFVLLTIWIIFNEALAEDTKIDPISVSRIGRYNVIRVNIHELWKQMTDPDTKEITTQPSLEDTVAEVLEKSSTERTLDRMGIPDFPKRIPDFAIPEFDKDALEDKDPDNYMDIDVMDDSSKYSTTNTVFYTSKVLIFVAAIVLMIKLMIVVVVKCKQRYSKKQDIRILLIS